MTTDGIEVKQGCTTPDQRAPSWPSIGSYERRGTMSGRGMTHGRWRPITHHVVVCDPPSNGKSVRITAFQMIGPHLPRVVGLVLQNGLILGWVHSVIYSARLSLPFSKRVSSTRRFCQVDRQDFVGRDGQVERGSVRGSLILFTLTVVTTLFVLVYLHVWVRSRPVDSMYLGFMLKSVPKVSI
jgi:hypothetical protein